MCCVREAETERESGMKTGRKTGYRSCELIKYEELSCEFHEKKQRKKQSCQQSCEMIDLEKESSVVEKQSKNAEESSCISRLREAAGDGG
ncbi:MAG: hypothetical protein ACLVIY_08835 [Anaerobutyricum soehngenii]